VTAGSRRVGRPPLDAAPEDDVVQIPEAQNPRSPVLVRYRRIAYALVATDAACILVALVVSSLVASVSHGDAVTRVTEAAIASAMWVAVFHGFGLYAPQHFSPVELLRRIVGASSVGVMVLALTTIWSSFPSSRLWLAQTWCLALLLELAARRVWAWRFGKLRTAGVLCFRTLIIGTNEEAHRLYETLSVRGWGYEPLGFIGVDGDRQRVHGQLGRVETIDDAIAVHRPDCLFVASSAVDDETMLQVTRTARRHALEVRISANIPQILTDRVTVQQIASTLTLSLRPVRLTRTQEALKRGFDVIVATVALVLTIPLLALTAVAIKVTSRGPVLFRQRRVTRDDRVFTVYKFRTMRHQVDRVATGGGFDTSRPFFKMENDPRLTRVGALIRRVSLDEAPQLLNVLKGDMSLVGPRPLALEQVIANQQLMRDRHEVQAGVTGWWQINGRSDVTPEEAVEFDLFYIQNWSLALDLYILLKTMGAVVNQKGAY